MSQTPSTGRVRVAGPAALRSQLQLAAYSTFLKLGLFVEGCHLAWRDVTFLLAAFMGSPYPPPAAPAPSHLTTDMGRPSLQPLTVAVLLCGKAASAAGCCRLTCSMQWCLAAGASVLGQLCADGLAAAVLVGVVRLEMLCPGGQSAESPELHKCTQQTPSSGSEVVLVNQTGDPR